MITSSMLHNSIDESFLAVESVQQLWDSPTVMGQSIRQRVRKWTGLPVCVGLGRSKTLAKMANHIAKKKRHSTASAT